MTSLKLKAKLLRIFFAVLLSVFLGAGTAFAQPPDVRGHWAEKQINDWLEKGLASGYPDGTFRPDESVTRAEFITLVNKCFGFAGRGQVAFTDVSPTDWFFNEISKAAAAGYISGYEDGTFRPGDAISRQEAAVILARFLKLKTPGDKGALAGFEDAASIPQWSEGFVSAVVAAGYMAGYQDLTFRPEKSITRAEAVAVLDRAKGAPEGAVAGGKTFDRAGVYGPESGVEAVEGDVAVSAAGVTLRNTTISGDLVLTGGIGEGSVYFKDVTVKGVTSINGGGANSIHFEDCKLGVVNVNKEQGRVRVVASGRTSIAGVKLASGAILEESGLTGDGFTSVTAAAVLPASSVIELAGDFQAFEVEAPEVVVKVARGNIAGLSVAEKAAGTTVDIAGEAKVATLTLRAAAKVTGQGTVETALVKVGGVIIEQKPGSVVLAEGVAATVAGQEVKESTPVTGGGGGGAASPGSGNAGAGAPKITAATVTVGGKVVNVDIDDAGLNGSVDLSGLSGEARITSGTITVSKAATLTLRVRVGDESISKEQKLTAGENRLEALEIIGKSGMKLDLIKLLFSNPVVLTGTLKDNNVSSDVSLTVYLPD